MISFTLLALLSTGNPAPAASGDRYLETCRAGVSRALEASGASADRLAEAKGFEQCAAHSRLLRAGSAGDRGASWVVRRSMVCGCEYGVEAALSAQPRGDRRRQLAGEALLSCHAGGAHEAQR